MTRVADVSDSDPVQWLVGLFDELAMDYRRIGAPQGAVTADRLAQLRKQLDEQIRSRYGGQAVYFPVHANQAADRARRDAEIVRQVISCGMTQVEVARVQGLSVKQVGRIVGAARKGHASLAVSVAAGPS